MGIVEICAVFGCGKHLTAIEKLCGNKCLKHQGSDMTVITAAEALSKLNSLDSLKEAENEDRTQPRNDLKQPDFKIIKFTSLK